MPESSVLTIFWGCRRRSTSLSDMFPRNRFWNCVERFFVVCNRPNDQVDERSPEERRTRLKKADSIRRMLAESQANQPIPSEWEKCQIIDNNWMKCVMSQMTALYICSFYRTRGRPGRDCGGRSTAARTNARSQSGRGRLSSIIVLEKDREW